MQVERHKHLGIALELRPTIRPSMACSDKSRKTVQWRMPQAVVEDYLSNPEAKATVALYRARREKSTRYGAGTGNWPSGVRRTA